MRFYETGSPAADQLLDRLVGFLRTAMPSLRGGASSTLAAELEVVRSYVRLRTALYRSAAPGTWRRRPISARWRSAAATGGRHEPLDGLGSRAAGGVMRITRREGGARVELNANSMQGAASVQSVESTAAAVPAARPMRLTFDFFNPAALPVTP